MKKYFYSIFVLLAMICSSSYSMHEEIEFVSKDGEIVKIVPIGERIAEVKQIAEISKLFKDMLEDRDEEEVLRQAQDDRVDRIPVPVINFKELAQIVKFMRLEHFFKRQEHKNDLQIRETFARLLKSMVKGGFLRFEDIKLLLEAAAYLGCENILQALVYYIIDKDPIRFLNPELLALKPKIEEELNLERLEREKQELESPQQDLEIGAWKSVGQMMEEERSQREWQEGIAGLFNSIFDTFNFSYQTYRDILKPYVIKIIETRIPHYVRGNAHKKGFNIWRERVIINPRVRQLVRETIEQIIDDASEGGRGGLKGLLATIEEDGAFKGAVQDACKRPSCVDRDAEDIEAWGEDKGYFKTDILSEIK